jgi:MFS family permease
VTSAGGAAHLWAGSAGEGHLAGCGVRSEADSPARPRLTAPLRQTPDRANRRAVTAAFLANGLTVATWLSRIPDVREELGLSASTLGLVLLGMSAGVLLALPIAGGLVPRFGSRRVLLVGAGVAVLSLPAVGLSGGPWTLAAVLLVLGAGASAMDIAMNAQGAAVERVYARSIMVGFHGAWSVGALLGALAGSVAAAIRLPVLPHFALAAVAVAVVTLVALPWLRVTDRTGVANGRPRLAWPHGALVPLALVALASSLGESTASDWSGVHLRDVVGVPAGRAPWGFVAFTAAMVVARLSGDLVARRLGAATVVRLGGALAGLGFVLVALVPTLPVALVGFAMVGLGVAPIVPLVFSAAAAQGRSAGEGIAAVATVGYGGFLAGPPIIGFVADQVDLRVSLLAVGVLVAAMTVRRGPLAGREG